LTRECSRSREIRSGASIVCQRANFAARIAMTANRDAREHPRRRIPAVGMNPSAAKWRAFLGDVDLWRSRRVVRPSPLTRAARKFSKSPPPLGEDDIAVAGDCRQNFLPRQSNSPELAPKLTMGEDLSHDSQRARFMNWTPVNSRVFQSRRAFPPRPPTRSPTFQINAFEHIQPTCRSSHQQDSSAPIPDSPIILIRIPKLREDASDGCKEPRVIRIYCISMWMDSSQWR